MNLVEGACRAWEDDREAEIRANPFRKGIDHNCNLLERKCNLL